MVFLCFVLLHSGNSDHRMVQGALALSWLHPPKNIVVSYNWLPDGKINQMWAMMDMSLSDATNLAYNLHVPIAPSGNWIVDDPESPNWWSALKQEGVSAVTTKWLNETPQFSPSILSMVWVNGKLWIYLLGIYGAPGTVPAGLNGKSHSSRDGARRSVWSNDALRVNRKSRLALSRGERSRRSCVVGKAGISNGDTRQTVHGLRKCCA
jgi:hypothetical protein